MKKLFIFLSTIFLAVMTMAAWAQENPKLSYQAVVRDNQNKLLTNSTVNVEINILKPNDAVQYTETFNSVPTNQNGLMSLLIGNNPSWDNVDWFKAKINVKITLPGDMGMVESVSDVSAVPLAISALYADSVNLDAVPQSDWNETNPSKCTFIKNKPNIPDTIKDQLADGNSVINHIVDTIADNHIQWATDTLISNRELRDTMNVARGALADTASVLRGIISTLNTNLQSNIDSTSQHVRSALVDTAKNLRDAINDINTNLCTTVMACADIKTMRDSIQTNKNAIVTNATNIAANATAISTETTNRTAADNEIKDIVKADSTDIMKNVSDTAKAIRALITGASGDINHKVDSLNKNLFDTLHIKYVTNTVLADTIKDVRDSISALRDSMTTNYVSNADLCDKVMACPDIQKMRDSIQTNKNAIVANATAISDEITNRTAADTEIKGIIKADSTVIMQHVSDTATAIRALITGASGDINHKVDSLNKNLFDTLHIKYVTNTVLADTIKDVRDSISALRDSMTTNYVSNADLCDKVMACADIKTMRDSIQTNAANIKADSIFFAGRVKNLSDSVKMNVQAIIDSSKNIRKEIKDTASTLRGLITDANKDVKALKDSVEHNYVSNTKLNDTLNHYINEVALTDSIITKSGLADTAKHIRDFVTTNYVSSTDLCAKVMNCEKIQTMRDSIQTNNAAIADNAAAISTETTNRTNADNEIKGIINADSIAIMQHVSDTATAIRALITGAHGDVGKLNAKVDSLNKNLFDTLHIKYVTNTVLADTIKDVRDSISALRDSMTTNYVSNADLCDKIAPCISNLRDSVKNNAIAIHEDSVLFADRIKNLSDSARNNAIRIKNLKDSIETNITNINNLRDSVKMNVQAIIDSSAHIRNEISAATADLSSLETRFKADSANLANNYYTKTKINDTLSKYSTTAAMDARHYLTSDSTIIKNMNDTLAKHNTRISANYKGIIDTASAIRTFVTTNYVSNSDLCNKVAPCVNAQMKDLRDSVNTLYVHTTKAALRDSVAGQIHDSLSTFSSTLHTHANKAILDATTASYTTAERTKLTGIAEGAEVNVNADWTATSGDAQILNKPTTISGYGITDAKIDMTKKQVIMGTDTLDVSDAAKDGKLTLKVNGDSIGSFSANQATNTEINIKCRQTSVRLKLTEETVDTLSVGMVLAIPTNFNAVDSVDHLIQLYINGVYVGDTVDGVLVYSNGKLTYDATKNDNKILVADERIQVVYWVK